MTEPVIVSASFIDSAFAHLYRCLGFAALLPIGSGAAAAGMRGGVAVLLALLAASYSNVASDPLDLLAVVGELVFGCMIAMPLVITVSALEMSADLLDSSRGQNLGTQIDPFGVEPIAALALVVKQWAIVIVCSLGALEHAFAVLIESFQTRAIDSPMSVTTLGADILRFATALLSNAVMIVVPFLVAFLFVECCAAAINRVCAGLQLSELTHAVKLLMCVVLLLVASESEFVSQLQAHTVLGADRLLTGRSDVG